MNIFFAYYFNQTFFMIIKHALNVKNQMRLNQISHILLKNYFNFIDSFLYLVHGY